MTDPLASSTKDGNNILMQGGGKYHPFKTVGTTIAGRITAPPKAQQQTDMKTGEPKFFPSGDPMMTVVVELATALRDPMIGDDDGARSVWLRSGMIKAVREAVVLAGGDGLAVGGELTLTYIGDAPPTKPGFDGLKMFSASYVVPPPSSSGNAALMGASPPVTPAVPSCPPGVDAVTWAGMSPEQRATVQAALAPSFDAPPF